MLFLLTDYGCADPGEIPDGLLRGDPPYPVGSRVMYDCARGYQMEGGSSTCTCRFDGINDTHWDPDPTNADFYCKDQKSINDFIHPVPPESKNISLIDL